MIDAAAEMTPSRSPEEIRNILSQEGVRFIPKKRTFDLSHFLPQAFTALSARVESRIAQSILAPLADYLAGEPMFDNFGNNMSARDEWRERLRKQYGADIVGFYQRFNRLRLNNISDVILALDTFDYKTRLPGAILMQPGAISGNSASGLREGLLDVIQGRRGVSEQTSPKRYNQMGIKEKLEVVQLVEKSVISFFRSLGVDVIEADLKKPPETPSTTGETAQTAIKDKFILTKQEKIMS